MPPPLPTPSCEFAGAKKTIAAFLTKRGGNGTIFCKSPIICGDLPFLTRLLDAVISIIANDQLVLDVNRLTRRRSKPSSKLSKGVGYKWHSAALVGAFVDDGKDEFCRRCDEEISSQELESGAVRACACCTWVWHRECLLPPISATAVVPSDSMFACSFECVAEVPETFSLHTFSG